MVWLKLLKPSPVLHKGWAPLVLFKVTAALGGAAFKLDQNMQLNAGQINFKSHLHSWMSKQKSAMTELWKKEVLLRILRPLSVLMPSPDSSQPSWLSPPAKASTLYSSTRVRVVANTVQLRFSLFKTASPTWCQCALISAPLQQGLQDTHGRS